MSSKTSFGKVLAASPAGFIRKSLKSPKGPDLPAAPEEVEEIETVTADATKAQKRKKKGIRQGGRQSTVLSGIQSALKKRLGE